MDSTELELLNPGVVPDEYIEYKLKEAEKKLFLIALARTGKVRLASRAIGKKSTVWYHRLVRADKDFKMACELAMIAAADNLEMEAIRRAEQGTLEPVFYKGQVVGHIRRYSDSLLMFLLKSLKPEKYRDSIKVDADVNGKFGIAVVPMTNMDVSNWEQKAEMIHEKPKLIEQKQEDNTLKRT